MEVKRRYVGETITDRRINEYTEELRIIPDEQPGLRRGHSTEQKALRLVEYANKGFQRRIVTGIIFTDVSKTKYDRVWLEDLVTKMKRLGYPLRVAQLIDLYLRGRSQSRFNPL